MAVVVGRAFTENGKHLVKWTYEKASAPVVCIHYLRTASLDLNYNKAGVSKMSGAVTPAVLFESSNRTKDYCLKETPGREKMHL